MEHREQGIVMWPIARVVRDVGSHSRIGRSMTGATCQMPSKQR